MIRRFFAAGRSGVLRAVLALAAAIVLAACATSTASQSPSSVVTTAPKASPTSVSRPATNSTNSTAPAVMTKLNLNTATPEQFLTVPGVGDRMVREFLEYRPYRSIQQFRREIGKYIPLEQVTAYEQYVFVPVVPNEADAETLGQLPGVDATLAAQLIAGRPYASADAFLAKLAQHLPANQATVARDYLTTP